MISYGGDKLKIWQILNLKLNLTLKVKLNHLQINKNFEQGGLHLCSKNRVSFDFEVKFDNRPKTTGTLTKVFYTYGPNLVILAWTGDELSCGQACDYRKHRWTHRRTDTTKIPEGQNWPRVIKIMLYENKLNFVLNTSNTCFHNSLMRARPDDICEFTIEAMFFSLYILLTCLTITVLYNMTLLLQFQ